MRVKKFESGLLVATIALFVQPVAIADVVSMAPAPAVTSEVRHVPASAVAVAQARLPQESLQFAGISPTSQARAATLDDATVESPSSLKDLLALILVGAMLVAYQLFRKHRLLRQQPFSL